MAMRGTVHLRRRAGSEFVRNLIGLLVAYAPIAAILTFAAGVPLGGVLMVGVIGVPALAALLTVLSVGVGGGDPHLGGSRPYDYDPGSDPTLRSGAGYGASGGSHNYSGHGGGHGGHGGADGGGGLGRRQRLVSEPAVTNPSRPYSPNLLELDFIHCAANREKAHR
jgi:hypothetical protein